MQVIAVIRKNTIFYVYEIINEHLRSFSSGFYPTAVDWREILHGCVTLVAMVQEEMFVQVLEDPDAATDGPDFSPCRILTFKDDKPARCSDERLMQLICLLDK
jgi:hypothetical protein